MALPTTACGLLRRHRAALSAHSPRPKAGCVTLRVCCAPAVRDSCASSGESQIDQQSRQSGLITALPAPLTLLKRAPPPWSDESAPSITSPTVAKLRHDVAEVQVAATLAQKACAAEVQMLLQAAHAALKAQKSHGSRTQAHAARARTTSRAVGPRGRSGARGIDATLHLGQGVIKDCYVVRSSIITP